MTEALTTIKDKITNNTMVSVGLVVSLLGGSGGLAAMYASVQESAHAVEEIKARQSVIEERVYKELRDINKRLSRIEGKLEK